VEVGGSRSQVLNLLEICNVELVLPVATDVETVVEVSVKGYEVKVEVV